MKVPLQVHFGPFVEIPAIAPGDLLSIARAPRSWLLPMPLALKRFAAAWERSIAELESASGESVCARTRPQDC